MKSLPEIATFLRERAKTLGLTREELGVRAGVTRKTLWNVLSGSSDYKVTTLLAILDRLGYELAIVPKGAAAGLANAESLEPTPPAVMTRVQAARNKLNSGQEES
jgi:transcriptional regulator with XRE-family HTH domain